MYDTMIVQVSNCGQYGADEVCSIGFEVTAFTADAVEQLSTQGEISDQVHWIPKRISTPFILSESESQRQNIRLFMVSK